MAEMNKRTSGTVPRKSKQKGAKPKGSTSTKQTQQETSGIDLDNELKCSKCENVFVDDDDELLECERCCCWFCIECAGIDPTVYNVMISNKNLHWFCHSCEKPALTAIKCDKDIEEKCAAYMNSLTEKIADVEAKLENKAEKCDVESLEKRVMTLEKMNPDMPSETQQDTISEAVEEQRERELRACNLILQNVPESNKSEIENRKSDDVASVGDILNCIGSTKIDILKCVRLGKKEENKNRTTRITVDSAKTQKDILTNSRRLKDNPKYKDIYIAPDLTKLQREEQYKLRKELRERRERGEKDIFIRGRRIIRAKDRALQFKGGSSSEDQK